MKRSCLAIIAFLAALSKPAGAQELRGTVRDSASSTPVRGAVVLVFDSVGNTLARNITGERGQYRVTFTGAARRVRLLRIGFAPGEFLVRVSQDGVTQRDFALVLMPTMLGQVKVTATPGCEPRPDRAEAFALLDQARAGLLATVVARETHPATVIRLAYDRTLDAARDSILRQTVRMETSDRATLSFNAVHSAIDFVRRGFRADSAATQTFYGPDADVLLDAGFTRGYCFHIMTPVKSRPHQMGLAFTPASRRRGRVDINGALWIDTVERSLKDIEFRYVGLDQLSEGLGAGGSITFHTMPSGIVLINRWSLRLVGAADTVVTEGKKAGAATRGFTLRESGGELARAEWADGNVYTAPLGTLQLTAVTHAGARATGVMVGLEGTDYRATTDSAGVASIPFLIPGPYHVLVADATLAPLAIPIPTSLHFVARRSAASLMRLDTPTAEDFVTGECGNDGRDAQSAWLMGRVMTQSAKPVEGAEWRVRKQTGNQWTTVSERGTTGSNGLFHLCQNLAVGDTVEVLAFSDGRTPMAVRKVLRTKVTAFPVEMQSVVVARARNAPTATPTSLLNGTVTDSASGQVVPEARVSLVGTLLEAITDSSGHFLLGGVTRGEYTVQVNTPSLDSLGAVKRAYANIVDSTATLRLVVPSARQIAGAMCGPDSTTGVLIGRVDIRGDTMLPPDVRVVAQWTDALARHSEWVRTRADAQGTYRLCGVPLNTSLVLRTEVDSGVAAAARPLDTRIPEQMRYARADLTMDRTVVAGGVYMGIVSDSTGKPLADVDVLMPGLNRSMLTNAKGGFRFTEIPEGTQPVLLRRIGYAALTANVSFAANQTVEHRIPLKAVTALKVVDIVENTSKSTTFDDHKKLGLGSFLTRAELAKNENRRIGDVMASMSSIGLSHGIGGQAWVTTARAGQKILPRTSGTAIGGGPIGCGSLPSTAPGAPPPCGFNRETLRAQNIYCPTPGEERRGLSCACFARVYLDDKLANPGQPTEPFDLNTLPISTIESVEYYASPARTPAKYSTLGAACGVVVIWTRNGP